jgi:AcrR family transcriptional regulator
VTRTATLTRDTWIAAAVAAFARGGVDAVRVEALAAGLAVTKGSFYWRFRNRGDLLEAVLARWEEETRWVVAEATRADAPRDRLRRFFELVAATRDSPPDVEVRAWARRDPRVAGRVAATERRRLAFVHAELRRAGIADAEAGRRARAAYLATQGWVECVSCGVEGHDTLPEFTRHLFDLVLAPLGAPAAPAAPPDADAVAA